ncbi:MAG: LysR family transcriptional regulator [Bacteroidales bacterium]|nr:LysR family transcriptional regulator [Bacteroidales bacterium]
MELRQLSYFIAAAQTENFSKAAAKCFVVQSTLSQQVKQLEDELEVQLFDRIGKRVTLTEAGKAFLPFAIQTVELSEQGKQEIKDLQGLKKGSLRVGVSYGLSSALTRALQKFCPRFPEVCLDIRFRTDDALLELLHLREIDFALMNCPSDVDAMVLEVKPLFTCRLCAFATADHPLASFKEVKLRQLKPFLLEVPAKGMDARKALDNITAWMTGHDWKPLIEIDDLYTMIHMVRSCHLVAVLPESFVYPDEGLIKVPISDARTEFQGALVSLKDSYKRKAVEEFFSNIQPLC